MDVKLLTFTGLSVLPIGDAASVGTTSDQQSMMQYAYNLVSLDYYVEMLLENLKQKSSFETA